jgi:hypothetical protein
MAATESILDSVKEGLGVPVEDTGFDSELALHINSVLSTLRQLGVGPAAGFMITGNSETWTDFLGDKAVTLVDSKTYMVLRIKLLFDPPPTSFALDAIKEQIQEAAWRLNVTREETDWVNPVPPPVVDPYSDPTLF